MRGRRKRKRAGKLAGEKGKKTMEEIRLNKYLSEMGICSRREADRLIEAGKVLAAEAQRIRLLPERKTIY